MDQFGRVYKTNGWLLPLTASKISGESFARVDPRMRTKRCLKVRPEKKGTRRLKGGWAHDKGLLMDRENIVEAPYKVNRRVPTTPAQRELPGLPSPRAVQNSRWYSKKLSRTYKKLMQKHSIAFQFTFLLHFKSKAFQLDKIFHQRMDQISKSISERIEQLVYILIWN